MTQPIPSTNRRSLYPEIEPYATGRLKVSDLHEIYFEQSGNPDGIPAVFVHGGPGGGSEATYRRAFDPQAYRIILFDQRGCGQSTPHAELRANTTWDLVADMERLRDHLGIETWLVLGGSWGSTLALAYAVTHPERVRALVLRGIFMLRKKELHWFYQEGASYLFPDLWADYLAPIPPHERDDLMAAYYRRLTGDDPVEQMVAARAWSRWEGSTLSLLPDKAREKQFEGDHFALAFARIECHYFVNAGFFESDGWLLGQAARLKDIPGVIVQGRYDVVTPMLTAWELHKAWPEADLRIVSDAGHAFSEPGIVHETIAATDRFARRLGQST